MAKKGYIGVNNIARKIKKGYIGIGIPSGYTPIEYIQSTGTQYINTGLTENAAYGMSMKFQVTGTAIAWQSLVSGTLDNFTVGTRNTDTTGFYIRLRTSEVYNTSGVLSAGSNTLVIKNGAVQLNGTQIATYSHGALSTASKSMYIFANNALSRYGCMRLYTLEFYDSDGKVVRNFVPCKNASGTVGLYDLVNDVFYSNAGSGTFTAGATVSFGGIARRIKKAYVGIGGVARPCWSGAGVEYYGTIESLSTARYFLAATTVGNYALFGGGSNANGTAQSTVDAYNASLTRTTPTALSAGRSKLAATTVGNYALFGGGYTESASAVVDAYNASLTRTTPTALSAGRQNCSATTVGNYALFGGGMTSNVATTSTVNAVDAYDASLTRTTPTALSSVKYSLDATTVGNYALFGGGSNANGTAQSTVDAYNASLTRSTPTALSKGRRELAATTVGNYALFGGGYSTTDVVDAYNASLTRTTPTALSTARYRLAATTVGNYALFGGGYSTTDVVDAYIYSE